MTNKDFGRRDFLKGAVIDRIAATTRFILPQVWQMQQPPRQNSRPNRAGMTMHVILTLAAVAVTTSPHMALAEGNTARGEKWFADCATCHSLEKGVHKVGPSLHGVFGRKAGGLADYRYSPAFKRSGITWTAQTLDQFLADPLKVVPASYMPYEGISDASDRADLIAYLEKATK